MSAAAWDWLFNRPGLLFGLSVMTAIIWIFLSIKYGHFDSEEERKEEDLYWFLACLFVLVVFASWAVGVMFL